MSEIDFGSSFDMCDYRPHLRDGKAYVTRHCNGIARNEQLSSSDGVFFSVEDWIRMDTLVCDTARSELVAYRELVNVCVKQPLDDSPFISKGAKQNCIADAARAVAEKVERIILGVDEPLVFNGTRYYGLCNHPNRNTASLTNPYKDNERDPQWSLELFNSEFARIEARLRCHSDSYIVFVSPDWVYLGVKPQDIKSFLCKEAVLSRQLPPGTIVACEMSKETIQVCCKQDVMLIQSYPKHGTACDINDVLLTVCCSIFPVIRNGQGIMHMKVNPNAI